MKKFIYLPLIVFLVSGCCGNRCIKPLQAEIIETNLKFNEGTVTDGINLYVSNFGGEELNPLNTNGNGYIVKLTADGVETVIPATGALSAPKGMAISGDKMLIADVQSVLIYSLGNPDSAPIIITLPDGNPYLNDIVVSGNNAYISVTNSGKIFKLDVETSELIEFADVVGANGLLLDGNKMYVASYPADGITNDNNVIYVIDDIDNPVVAKFIERNGQYDGLALSVDKSKLYFTSWVNGEVGYVDMRDKSVTLLEISNYKFTGPADITLLNGKLYIPDLPNSKLVVLTVE